MNLFYCNGIVSTIVASTLIKKDNFKDQENLLILEIEDTKTIPLNKKDYTYEYHLITRLFAKSASWKKIIPIKIESTFVSLEKLGWFFKLIPIRHFRLVKKKNISKRLKRFFKILPIKKIAVSDNAILWRHLFKASDVTYIEHGAASYRENRVNKNWKFFIKAIYSKMIGINLNIQPSSIYLSDNKRSYRVKNFDFSQTNLTPHSLNIKTEIIQLFDSFLDNYRLEYPEAYEEILNIKKNYDDICIYLPTALIPHEEYTDYLKTQIFKHKKIRQKTIFLIKPHANDLYRDYSKYFSNFKLNTLQFKIQINKFIPSEMLLYFFSNSVVFGSYSSVHLYSNWWLNKKTVFAEVKNSSIQKILTHEYQSVYNDFKVINNNF